MISHFVFDIGKVTLKFDFGITAARLAPQCPLPESEILPALQPLQIDLETGRLDTNAFAEAGMELIGYSGERDTFVRAFQDIFTLNEPIAALIDELAAADQPLYLLSNTSELHVSWFTQQYGVFDRFRDAVYSHEAGCMKPDAEIFHHAVSRFGLDPAGTIYIDDLPANVAAAADIGFRALVYDHQDHADFRARFDALMDVTG
jgi:HAD superfamily hydrolase (TIGR01509 family)